MQCVGNAKQLKARYGGSYVFTITTPSNYEQEVDSMVRRLFPSANKTYHISGTQKFELPKHEVRIADVFKQLTMPRTGSRFRHGVLLILLWRMSSSRFHAGSRCSMLHDSYNWQFFIFFLKGRGVPQVGVLNLWHNLDPFFGSTFHFHNTLASFNPLAPSLWYENSRLLSSCTLFHEKLKLTELRE